MTDHEKDVKTVDLTEDDPQSANDTKRKPSVHYQDEIPSPVPNSARPLFTRFESTYTDGGSGSRTPSIAGTETDDDEEDYDWSGEEDLVDEEATLGPLRLGAPESLVFPAYRRAVRLISVVAKQ